MLLTRCCSSFRVTCFNLGPRDQILTFLIFNISHTMQTENGEGHVYFYRLIDSKCLIYTPLRCGCRLVYLGW